MRGVLGRGGPPAVYGDLRGEFPDTLGDSQLDDFFTLVLERRKSLEVEEQRSSVMAADTTPGLRLLV